MCKYIFNITILGPKAKLLTPLSTVAVRKHTRFKRQRVFSEGVTTDAHTKLLLCPKGPRVYVCINSCAQTCTHACTHSQDRGTLDSEGGCWSKQTEKKKIQDFQTHHKPWMEKKDRKKRKFGFTLSSSSFNSNLSLSRSSWTWRAFKARHTVLKKSGNKRTQKRRAGHTLKLQLSFWAITVTLAFMLMFKWIRALSTTSVKMGKACVVLLFATVYCCEVKLNVSMWKANKSMSSIWFDIT